MSFLHTKTRIINTDTLTNMALLPESAPENLTPYRFNPRICVNTAYILYDHKDHATVQKVFDEIRKIVSKSGDYYLHDNGTITCEEENLYEKGVFRKGAWVPL